MSRPDPNEEAFKRLERRGLRAHYDHRARLTSLRRVAARLCRLHDVPAVTVYVRSKRGCGASYVDDTIQLDPECGQNLCSLLHELAHHIVGHRHPRAADHGPRFVHWYGHLLDAARLVPLAGFRSLCRRYGVKR
jgi:hypothetical protein